MTIQLFFKFLEMKFKKLRIRRKEKKRKHTYIANKYNQSKIPTFNIVCLKIYI